MTAALSLAGVWIGATREEDVAHVWRIVQRGESAFIYAALNEHGEENYYSARIVSTRLLINGSPHAASLVDADHFVLTRWHDDRDMLFSRAGVAELLTADVWTRYHMKASQSFTAPGTCRIATRRPRAGAGGQSARTGRSNS